MKRLLLILALAVATVVNADAQSIRLGERIPKIDVDSPLGNELELSAKGYICLLFIHSESEPCHVAMRELANLSTNLAEEMEIVLITAEEQSCDDAIAALMGDVKYTLAYDLDHRTFKSFGINYVPFCVVYDTKHKRTEWFGAVQQLTASTLNRITDK